MRFLGVEYEDDQDANSSWATGDWNGDREFDSGDLVMAFQDGGFELGPRAAVSSVTEPAAIVLVLTGLFFSALKQNVRHGIMLIP